MPSSPINSSSCLASPVCPASPTFGLNHQASPKLARCELLTNGLKPLWRTCEHAGHLPSLPLPPLSLSECLALWSWTPTMLDLGHPLWAGLSFLMDLHVSLAMQNHNIFRLSLLESPNSSCSVRTPKSTGRGRIRSKLLFTFQGECTR